jgi:mercuric ion transport protein
MMQVELIYDTDCPNVELARRALLEAFNLAGLQPSWTEWDRESPESPAYVRGYGSPTILVKGRDVAGVTPGNGESSCRLYRNGSGSFQGAPSAEQVAEALRADSGEPPAARFSSSGWRSSLATVPGIAIAFLPKLACPACWPAYAGLLSSVGLGFLLDTAYLFPLTAVFLALAVGALAFGARTRRRYGPLGVGLAAAVIVLVGKFIFDSNTAMYGGIGLLVAASMWNAWPMRNREPGSCPECNSQKPAVETNNAP